ncbi:MAG: ABC-2 family transporter protein [Armatimonadota bacterium]
MRDDIRLYLRYVGVSVRGQMQYPASFIMLLIGHLLATGGEFLGIWALIHRFGSLRGWSLAEVGLLYGIVSIAFSISDATSRGFDAFAGMLKRGDFDRVLLRPRSSALQLAGQELTMRRIGRLSQALAVLLWSASALGAIWSPIKAALVAGAILGGACLFFGLIVLQATTAFLTTESLEIFNTVTYGGVETAQFPLSIYRPWFRRFFTAVIPLAFVSYFPALAILNRPAPPVLPWVAPLAGLIFLAIALRVWHFGVRHYCSTGS